MIEFVVREGPMFEAMIMNREINNPMYRSVQLHISNTILFYQFSGPQIFSLLKLRMHMLMFWYFFLPGFYLRIRAQHMCTTVGSSTPYYRSDFCLLTIARAHIQTKFQGFVFMSTVKYFFGRVKHQANGEQMTLECLRMALCGVRLLLIHTSMVLMMMVMKRRKRKRAARKAA